MTEFLEKILASTRSEVEKRKRDTPVELLQVSSVTGSSRRFVNAVAEPGVSVIAEIKRASPSKGMIRQDLDVSAIVAGYERAGARAISVLTEEEHFLGSLDDLKSARKACSLPLLRKDFIIDPYQVREAAAFGADAVLLIVAALKPGELLDLSTEAGKFGLDCLVEVHDAAELKVALDAGARLIGINNRDLRTFNVSLETTLNLIEFVPEDCLVVSESGIRDRNDVAMLVDAGVSAVLVGETLMLSPDPESMLKELIT